MFISSKCCLLVWVLHRLIPKSGIRGKYLIGPLGTVYTRVTILQHTRNSNSSVTVFISSSWCVITIYDMYYNIVMHYNIARSLKHVYNDICGTVSSSLESSRAECKQCMIYDLSWLRMQMRFIFFMACFRSSQWSDDDGW